MMFSLGWRAIAQHTQISPRGMDERKGLTAIIVLLGTCLIGVKTW